MKWYIVVGRQAFDDEDTILIFHKPNESAAERAFTAHLIEQSEHESLEDYPVIINYVIECMSEPKIVVNQV